MKELLLALALATAVSTGLPMEPAQAACTGHQAAIVAGVGGAFRVCPKETDALGGTVGPNFYRSCTVTVVWPGGGSAQVTVDAPSPGVPYLVRFPTAYGAGGATAYCTNVQAVSGAVAASAITFPDLPAPTPPELLSWTGGDQVP